jgi:hypothetical protein
MRGGKGDSMGGGARGAWALGGRVVAKHTPGATSRVLRLEELVREQLESL